MKRTLRVVLLLAIVLGITSGMSRACPVCFGETDAKTMDGMNSAILFLFGLTGGMFGVIAAFMIRLRLRARAALRSLSTKPEYN